MATFDLGRVTPIYKGDYNAATSYELNDVVLYNGNLYWHVRATATVGILPTDTTVWKLAFADEGIRAEIRGYADNAQASADSASASKTAAEQSASQASASESQAAQSAQTAQTAETGATASAQTASTKASEASASAQSAASSAQTATDKATLASQKASEASASASTASEAKTAAITNAQLSVTKADEARSSATQAANSATSAQTSASAASASETAAATSETNAAASEAAAKRYAEDSAAYFGAYPTDTASGVIASFSDGANAPVKSIVVGIEPAQSGTGDPSPENVRPITGWTGAKISKSGINLWDEEWVVGTVSSVGVPYYLEGKIRSKNYIPVKQGTTLYFKCPSELRVAQYDASKTFISYTAVTNGTLTMTDKTCFVMFTMAKADETYDGDISINYPATDTVYHPYSGESIDISFPTEAGTVYGGSLDVTNGVLTVDKASMTVASAGLNGIANGMQIISATPSDKAYGVDNVISNLFATGTSGAYTVNGNTSNLRVDFRIPMTDLGITESDSSSVRQNAVNEWMANHSTQLVYGITPITYSLTPTEVKSLLGQNNIWADAGDTTVEYRADTSAYIAKKIAEAISALS